MKLSISFRILFAIPLFVSFSTNAQQNFYDINTVQKIEVFLSQYNWDYRMDTAKYGSETYLMADSVLVNGVLFDSTGIKYKGNSSFDSTLIKNPIHIALDEFKNQAYQNYTDIKLSNCYQDPSMIREVLSYKILGNYMHCPKSNFAGLYINGSYIGLYSNDENVNKTFCSNHFNSSQNTFIKCNPIVLPGPTTKSNLKYLGSDSLLYSDYYEIKSNSGWNVLVTLCDSTTNNQNSLANVFNLDRVLWMMAFNNVMVNLDSYSGVFCQNYYLYKDNSGRYNPIIWDLNMSFGGFPFTGNGTTGMGSLTIANMQQLALNLHSTDVNWPLIKAVMNNSLFKRMYIAHAKTIVNDFFANNLYLGMAAQLQAIIDTSVLNDPNKQFTYSQFQNAMNTSISTGSYSVPGISTLMSSRLSYLQSTADFIQSQPVITNVIPNATLPAINSNITITANISGATVVYLNYRFDEMSAFQKLIMYDDGLHNDGIANDNVFGVSFQIQSFITQYYIYAENANAGMFSPERAEHEFYTLQANVPVLNAGDIAINEFLASNKTNTTNESGAFSDWIELYNTTNNVVDLYGCFLSDNFSNPTKFTFPANSIIQPYSYIIIWADDVASTSQYLHANFKLSISGEQLILSNAAGTIIDSLSYGIQTDDVSFGRCPNGSGAFDLQLPPTFKASNCDVGIDKNSGKEEMFLIYPNPASKSFTINISDDIDDNLQIYNITGQCVMKLKLISNQTKIDSENFQNGIYFVKYHNKLKKLIIQK